MGVLCLPLCLANSKPHLRGVLSTRVCLFTTRHQEVELSGARMQRQVIELKFELYQYLEAIIFEIGVLDSLIFMK